MATDWTLALETATSHGSVALLRSGQLQTARSLRSRNYGDELFVAVEALLTEASLSLPELTRIAVADGPGSFTGVRVGLTAAKGWHEVLALPVSPISTLRAVVGTYPLPAMGALDASRGEVYFGCYSENGILEGLEPLPAFQERLRQWKGAAFTSDASLRDACPRLLEVAAELAPSVGWLGWREGEAGYCLNVIGLDARYLREPDAALPTPR